jgi:type III restriction enzyme
MPAADGPRPPIQPVSRPILCSPWEEPTAHWVYDTATGEASEAADRRPASYFYRTHRTGSTQLQMGFVAEEERDDLPLVNALRADVKKWRESGWESSTPLTKQLLRHWTRADRPRRLFFCQLEAVETIVYLTEILDAGKSLRGKSALGREDFDRLLRNEPPSFTGPNVLGFHPSLVDPPNEPGWRPLRRYGCKMATGSGKTVVMAMLIAWAFCNRSRVPGNDRFPWATLVVCPNLTIKERLQVLRPEHPENYYAAFDLVPPSLLPELAKGKVLVTNWHLFAPESAHAEGGRTWTIVNKGEESPEAFARRCLGDLAEEGPILVLNDEAHHAYRPAPVPGDEPLSAQEKADREEATVWVSGLDRLHAACGVRFCVDLSATPFYLQGSGRPEGAPFPWLVSDFGLVDAIESGIVKIPRLPVSDTTGRPEPKYFALWRHINERLQPGERLPGGKPKPEVVWREAEDALATLMGQWKERFDYLQQAVAGQERIPPVLIVVCDNVDLAKLFYENISGEQTVDVSANDGPDDEEADDSGTRRARKSKTRTVHGAGRLFPELFSNRPDFRPTLRIDSKLLAEAESDRPGGTRSDAADELRRIVATVGKPGQAGEQVRCVVSVQMLTEGWDAKNVTHILGLRAFTTQLLCEQVVGRGLRRLDYTPDPATGRLTEEYVDVYGVPFSIIPFKGRPSRATAPEDKPKYHVRAMEERKALEIRFPVVEGYVFALRQNLIKADLDSMEPLDLEPSRTPVATFVKPQVGYQVGVPSVGGGFEFTEQTRAAYYRTFHLQTIKFEIARQVVQRLQAGGNGRAWARVRSRHQLFPQVYRLVDEFVARKVRWNGCHPSELGLETYVMRLVERLAERIEPDDAAGEPPLLPVLNRYKAIGSTAEVDFKTVKRCWPTSRSHVNQVVLDTATWEQSAAFRLEQSPAVAFYARNDHLECVVPYEYLGVSHGYVPDFLVRLASGLTVLLEIKGYEDDQDRAKHEAAQRWVSAVTHWAQLGRWAFHLCRDPRQLDRELEWLSSQVPPDVADLEARHRRGYLRVPVQPGEFDVWESEQSWGDE